MTSVMPRNYARKALEARASITTNPYAYTDADLALAIFCMSIPKTQWLAWAEQDEEIARLKARVAELDTENAKLRAARTRLYQIEMEYYDGWEWGRDEYHGLCRVASSQADYIRDLESELTEMEIQIRKLHAVAEAARAERKAMKELLFAHDNQTEARSNFIEGAHRVRKACARRLDKALAALEESNV